MVDVAIGCQGSVRLTDSDGKCGANAEGPPKSLGHQASARHSAAKAYYRALGQRAGLCELASLEAAKGVQFGVSILGCHGTVLFGGWQQPGWRREGECQVDGRGGTVY